MIIRILLILAIFYSLAMGDEFPSEMNLGPYEGKIIRSIEIVRKNVFENGDSELPFYFRWANKIHILTRQSVIEGELLFSVGDSLDMEKVIESARNLRLRKFIGEVEISAAANGADSVDLTVTTHDNWTTKIATFLESGGGSYLYGAAIAEDNLLGYGRAIDISASFSEDNDGYAIYFNEDRLGRTRWSGNFLYSNYTLSDVFNARIHRPQYSLDVPIGASFSYNRTDGISRLYSGGTEFFRYHRLYNSLELNSNYSIGKEKRVNIFAAYNFDDYDYSEYYSGTVLNDIFIPKDERYSYPSLGFGGAIIRVSKFP